MSYLSVVLADNPTHWWRIADPVQSGVLFDLIATNRLGMFADTLQTGSGYTGPSSDGGSGYWISNAFHTRTHRSITLTLPITLETWVWFLGDPTAAMSILSTNLGFQTFIDTNLKVNLKGTNTVRTSPLAYSSEAWHHVVATFTTVLSTLYVDGSSVVSGADTNVSGSTEIALGSNLSSTTQFGGYLAEAAIWSGTALTGTQINNHFAAADKISSVPVIGTFSGNPGTTPPPVPGGETNQQQLTDILNSVRKTFPTT